MQKPAEARAIASWAVGGRTQFAISYTVRDAPTMGYVLTYGDQSISYGGGGYSLMTNAVLQGGSDYRKDGCAIGY
jgi:hypothetical protein